MKKGDVVTVYDYSWATAVCNGELIRDFQRRIKYTVVQCGCTFPYTSDTQSAKWVNDTVIQDIESGMVVFIHNSFLRLVPQTHIIIIDGKTIELSHESFKNLKEQLV